MAEQVERLRTARRNAVARLEGVAVPRPRGRVRGPGGMAIPRHVTDATCSTGHCLRSDRRRLEIDRLGVGLRQQAGAAQQRVDRAAAAVMSAASVASFGPATEGNPSQAFRAARLVRSKGDIKRSQRRAQGRYQRAGQPRLRRRLRCSSASAVADVGEDADAERGVDRQRPLRRRRRTRGGGCAAASRRDNSRGASAPRRHWASGSTGTRPADARSRPGSCPAADRGAP